MLKKIMDFFTYTLLKLEHGTHLTDAVYSFIYEAIKIFLLLSAIIFTVFVIRSYFPSKKTKPILYHKYEFMSNIIAACVIPIVYALMERGFSIGIVLVFMMAVRALSFPERIIAKNVLKTPLVGKFTG